jgi:excisionase family DNA binding protein
MQETTQQECLADQEEVAKFLQVPTRTLETWRRSGRGPRWAPVGRHVRYSWADVRAWLSVQTRGGDDAV